MDNEQGFNHTQGDILNEDTTDSISHDMRIVVQKANSLKWKKIARNIQGTPIEHSPNLDSTTQAKRIRDTLKDKDD